MNYNKLREVIKSKKISINSLVEKIGMSRNGYDAMIENKSMKVDVLEKICEVLEVPISDFFEEDIKVKISQNHNGIGNNNGITISDPEKEILHLKELLQEKERTIQILLNK